MQGCGRVGVAVGFDGAVCNVNIIIGLTLFIHHDVNECVVEIYFVDADFVVKNQFFQVDPKSQFGGREQGILQERGGAFQFDIVEVQREGWKMRKERQSGMGEIQFAF